MNRAEIGALSITIICLVAVISLFFQYPLLMFTLLVAAMTIMWILTKFAKPDYELWPDLYKK
jgi:hypothetical protein